MDNSRKSVPSTSTHISEEEEHKPKNLPQEHSILGLSSSTRKSIPGNLPNFIPTPTFPGVQQIPMILEGPRFWINPNGYVGNENVGSSDKSQTFREKLVVLQIPNGIDIIHCVTQFAKRYELAVTMLSGHGLISEVDIMYPRSQTSPMYISGNYQMVSFSGTYNCFNPSSVDIVSCFNVSLIGAEGNVMGGLIASRMKSASNVKVVASITRGLSTNVSH